MIGIGVGIDYALFIVTRYRQGIFEGRDPRDAVVTSLMTVGPVRPLRRQHGGDLALRPLPDRPGLHDRPGHGLHRRRPHGAHRRPDPAAGHARLRRQRHRQAARARACSRPAARRPRTGFWYRWSRFVQRRAWVTGIVAVLVLVVLALPLFSMRLAFTDAGNDPTSLTDPAGLRPAGRRASVPGSTDRSSSRPTCTAGSSDAGHGRPACSRPSPAHHDGIAFVTPAEFNAGRHRRRHRRLPDDVAAVGPDRDARPDACATT